MSWDIVAFASDTLPPKVANMPDDWRGLALGPSAEVRAAINECFPETDWTAPNWGLWAGTGYSFEFNIGKEEPCEHRMLHARGGGDAITRPLDFSKKTGCYLLDCSQREWIHQREDKEAGWIGFQQYREYILAKKDKNPEDA
jgi:hypothetical protein